MRSIIESKRFSFGKIAFVNSKRKDNAVEVAIGIYKDEYGRYSFSAIGNIWNKPHTDIYCGGQCLDTIKRYIHRNPLFNTLYGLWKRNHLNNMTPGSPRQMMAISDWEKTNRYDYQKACEYLKSINLYEDKEYMYNGKPYVYCSAWLYRPICDDDLKQISTLLGCDL